VTLSPLGTSATNWPMYQPRMINVEYGTVGGIRIGRGNRSSLRKPSSVSLCPPQIPHDQNRAQTRELTAWVMARPIFLKEVRRTRYLWGSSVSIGRWGLDFSERSVISTTASRPALELTRPPIRLVLKDTAAGKWTYRSTAKIKMRGTIPPLPSTSLRYGV
jgi:hypothetical protein